MSSFDRDAIATLAARAAVDAPTTDALLSFVARLDERARTAVAADLEAVREGRVTPREPLWSLLVAVLQLPEASARHDELGIDRDVSDATWRDIGLWATTFRERMGFLGITTEILSWAQSYLRGNVVRVGAMQAELRECYGCAFAFRHRETREVRWAIAPGTWLSYGGRRRCDESERDARRAEGEVTESFVRAHPIDVSRGVVDLGSLVTFDRTTWTTLLEPTSPMLEMHIPADASLDLASLVRSARQAEALFARFDSRKPAGMFGDAWLFDPQVRELLPSRGIAAFQTACKLVPGGIPEAKTIRRFFGPDATRASIVTQPRQKMTSLQRAIATFLEDPEKMLCATCGLILRDDWDAAERVGGG